MIQKHYLHLPVHYVKRVHFGEIEIIRVLRFCDDNASIKYNYDNVSEI